MPTFAILFFIERYVMFIFAGFITNINRALFFHSLHRVLVVVHFVFKCLTRKVQEKKKEREKEREKNVFIGIAFVFVTQHE